MPLYERQLGLEPGVVPSSLFMDVVEEWAEGAITEEQAQSLIDKFAGRVLTPTEKVEVKDLRDTVTGSPAARQARVSVIRRVFRLMEEAHPPYNTPAAIRTRLGVPER